MLFKNVASQGVYCFMIDSGTGEGKTGDASNISVTISLDGGATSASSNSVSEIGGGVYSLALAASETNADRVAIIPSSSTSNVVGSPIIAYTTGGAVPAAAAGGNGGLPTVDASNHVAGSVTTDALVTTVDSVADGIKAVTDNLPDSGALSSLATASALSTVDTVVDSILEDTGTTIPGTIATVDTVVDGIKAVTDNLPDSGALSSLATASALATVDGNVDSVLEDTGTTLPATLSTIDGKVDTVDTVADAIKAVTDNLPDSGALSSLATASAVATVDSNVDAVLVDTGTTLPATLSTIEGKVDTVDAVADGIKAVTDNLPDSGALSSLATASALATVDGNVDSVLEDTGTTIPATLSTIDGKVDTVDTVADAIKAVTDNLPDSGALSSLATASALATVDGNVDAILVDTGTTLPATLSTIEGKVDTVDTVVDSISSTLSSGVTVASISDGAIGADAVADIWSTTALAESYASDGSTGTPAQLLYMIQQATTEFAISGTSLTVKQIDGSTTAGVWTLDDASAPTSRTRAS